MSNFSITTEQGPSAGQDQLPVAGARGPLSCQMMSGVVWRQSLEQVPQTPVQPETEAQASRLPSPSRGNQVAALEPAPTPLPLARPTPALLAGRPATAETLRCWTFLISSSL